MNDWIIYTDGSCRANKNGGIGVVWLKNGNKVFEYSKGYKNTTNNQMELAAIGAALRSIKKPVDSLTIVSDSEYALGCIFNEKWHPKKNITLINQIKNEVLRVEKLIGVEIQTKHVDGHSGDKWNEYCDKLAQKESSYV